MIELELKGQLKSGKNHMLVLRDGRHIPLPKWAAWRNQMVGQILSQRPHGIITKPATIWVNYFAGDKRKRDVPGMLDALYHCLERAKVVKDDFFLDEVHWNPSYDKENPRTYIKIEER